MIAVIAPVAATSLYFSDYAQSIRSSAFDQGYQNGYLQGVKDGAGRGYNVRDPTYQEMLNFLAADQTDKNVYNEETFNCYDFTNAVCNNAFKAGIRSGDVWVDFPDTGHALVVFNTTDRGLVYVEPQSDGQMTLVVGQHYWNTSLYKAPSYNDTIIRFGIIW